MYCELIFVQQDRKENLFINANAREFKIGIHWRPAAKNLSLLKLGCARDDILKTSTDHQ